MVTNPVYWMRLFEYTCVLVTHCSFASSIHRSIHAANFTLYRGIPHCVRLFHTVSDSFSLQPTISDGNRLRLYPSLSDCIGLYPCSLMPLDWQALDFFWRELNSNGRTKFKLEFESEFECRFSFDRLSHWQCGIEKLGSKLGFRRLHQALWKNRIRTWLKLIKIISLHYGPNSSAVLGDINFSSQLEVL